MQEYKIPLHWAVLFAAMLAVLSARAQEAHIEVQAGQLIHSLSPFLTGACIEDVNHEIYGGIYSQMIFGESFQEPAQSPPIPGFKMQGGRWVVRQGVLSVAGLEGPKLVSERVRFKDGTVGVEVLFVDGKGDNAGLIVRAESAAAGADNFVGYEVSLDAGRQLLRLARHRHNFELIRDVPCPVGIGRWIPVEVRLAGSVIEIFLNGRSVLRHDDGPEALPLGTVALRAWHREASYRNLWVETGEPRENLAFAQAEGAPEVSGQWRGLSRGEAKGTAAMVVDHPFVGTQAQQIVFESGSGEWGVENQGLNRWGLNLVARKVFQGYVWARSEKPTTLYAALESRDGTQIYDEVALPVASKDWQRLDFTLTPNAADRAGRFALKLKQPSSVTLGHAFLEPGEWGRFKSLPVRRDVAEALISQGITVLRYGGSMVNDSEYRWKKMIGPRDRRPPYSGTWYAQSSNGWGILDFMDFCEAAGFEYVPAFNMGETPQDLADFIDYAEAPADTAWGGQRAAAGHPQPYRLRYVELGNEERVDENYALTFETLAKAIWAKDPNLILVVGDFAYNQPITDPANFHGAASRITTLAGQQRILQLAQRFKREVWFDVHVGTDGPPPDASFDGMWSFRDALAKVSGGARHRVVVFEFNAGNNTLRRALANALAIQAIERDGQIPIATSANCLQPDGQNDNGWDQGLLFLNPAQVWLQPPGYVTQMFARNYQPNLVRCATTGAESVLSANAKVSSDGRRLVLQLVNPGDAAIAAQIHLGGFVPAQPTAQVTELSGALDARNPAGNPSAIAPQQSEWKHGMTDGVARRTVRPHSFTVIRFE